MGEMWSKAAEACLTPIVEEATEAPEEEAGQTTMGLVVGILWFFAIALMFMAQHTTCDMYFVPAINVFVDKMRNSPKKWMQRWGQDAVAGATICALGCNGPELFSNLISLYTGSDAGIGVVVGSEIFNLLIIIGAATIAAPTLPLELEVSSFTRDVFFYGLSIALLTWVLGDGQVEIFESLILLGAAVFYVSAVYFTMDIENCIVPPKDDGAVAIKKSNTGIMHGIEVTIEECFHSGMSDHHHTDSKSLDLNDGAEGISVEDEAHAEKRKSRASEGGNKKRTSVAFQFTGGLDDNLVTKQPDMLKYADLKEVVVVSEGVIQLEFRPKLKLGLEGEVTLKIKCNTIADREVLLKQIEEKSLGRAWVHKYDATPIGAFQHFQHVIKDKDESCLMKFVAFPELIVETVLKSTMFWCDVKDTKKEGLWAVCFLMAMFWLAMFSWGMLTVAGFISDSIPLLSPSFLGITVCAVGTSFPNAVASIIMSSQDKPAAAIANALGSNVQNVFLAMALPWVIRSCTEMYAGRCMTIVISAKGINEGVMWMVGTLLLLLVLVFLPDKCTLTKSYGYVLCLVYCIYVVFASYEAFTEP